MTFYTCNRNKVAFELSVPLRLCYLCAWQLVELRGIEPLTSPMRTVRSPS